ncbi:MAG: MerR family transcriptional regulator [Ilumatobacter sp.]|uniref:MerR family transcriptional regulator n=1 Tax=Ilumatobacter sp. TaxID=1967498 RepID=UPI00391ABBBF
MSDSSMPDSTTADPGTPMLQIGDVAEAVGLSLRTIRYYEEAQLVPPSDRSAGGFRLYTDADVDRLRLVKQMKPLDLTIDEMRQLLEVRDRLTDQATPDSERGELVERLSMFADLAEERCLRLREQLAAGEALSATLRTEAASVSGSAL